jgi:hypothetical protein
MTGSYKKITLDAFARALEKNLDVDHVLLLGAGASQSSGVPTAQECIWEWKKKIYLSNNPDESQPLDCQSEAGQRRIQTWLDERGSFPEQGADDEYTIYAGEAFFDNEARRKYFEDMTASVEPGIGYRILALFADHGAIRIVLTTNFDGLAAKAMQGNGLRPREITIETSEFIHVPMRRGDCFHVALHGDYKFGKLKNTGNELDQQQEDFRVALRIHFYNKHLIVMGYSGRDKSLMGAIEEAYLKEPKGRGVLFWCSYSENVRKEVDGLLKRVSGAGREAVLVVAGDFDEALKTVSAFCLRSVPSMYSKLSDIVGFAGVDESGVSLNEIETDEPATANHAGEIAADIERLSPAALDAAAKALLIGAWTEDESDQQAVREATDDK